MELEQEDIVLCTVGEIIGTTVFVKIENINKTGSIVFSEIAPGRIRNIRDYVVPKKVIVCKVLKISPDNIELSLRRVKEKERKEAIEHYKIEKSYMSILKTILQEKYQETLNKIKEENNLFEFLNNSKNNSEKLEKLVGKEKSKKIIEMINSQKKKNVEVKKEIELFSQKSDGLQLLKEILTQFPEVEIKYIAAKKYSIKKEDEDRKKADLQIMQIISKIEQYAKSNGMEFKYRE